MREITNRTVLNVMRHEGGWSVEQNGDYFGQSPDKEVAKAAAHRRATSLNEAGQACQVRVSGETGFWARS